MLVRCGSGHTDQVPEDFVIARNPDSDSSLPYLVRIPLGRDGIVLKARDTWPRTAKIYCHRADRWPEEPELVERVPVRACVRRGAAIDLVLDRGRESRSQFVLTRIRGGREAIFWQSARTAKQARPAVTAPRGRAQGLGELRVLVDLQERYPYRFAQHAVTVDRRRLAAGDYAVEVELPPAGPLTAPSPTVAEVRAWARRQGLPVGDRGRLRPEVLEAYSAADPLQDDPAARPPATPPASPPLSPS